MENFLYPSRDHKRYFRYSGSLPVEKPSGRMAASGLGSQQGPEQFKG
jgi:hypothetical protein